MALKVFTDGNPFDVNGVAGDVLDSFVKWRKAVLIPEIRHDIGHLIV